MKKKLSGTMILSVVAILAVVVVLATATKEEIARANVRHQMAKVHDAYVAGLEQTVETHGLRIAQLHVTLNILDLLKEWQDEAEGLSDGQCRVRSSYLDHLYHDNVALAVCCVRAVTIGPLMLEPSPRGRWIRDLGVYHFQDVPPWHAPRDRE